jgi:hypothetical protein
MMKDKSGEFSVRLVLYKHDERQVRRFLMSLVLHKDFREKNQHLSLIEPRNKGTTGTSTEYWTFW